MKEQKNLFRAHPLIIFSYIKPFLFILLFPLFRAVVEFLAGGQFDNFVMGEFLAVLFLFVYAIIKWRSFLLENGQTTLKIRTGLFFLREAVLPKEKISTIEIIRNPIDVAFRCATMKINTETGIRGRTDYRLKIAQRDAEAILNDVSGLDVRVTVKFSPIRVAVMAAATSSSVTGMIIAVPLINRIGNLLGLALEEALIERINDVSKIFERFVPPVVNTVTLIFLFFYFLAFVYSFFKYVGFKLTLGSDDLEIRSGFLTRKRVRFKTHAVNTVCVEQNPLMRLIRRCLLRVEIGGYGNGRGEKAVIIPSAGLNEAKRIFSMVFPGVSKGEEYIRPPKHSRWRFFVVPVLLLIALVALCALLFVIFPHFSDLIGFLTLIALCVLLYYFELACYNFAESRVSFGEVIYIKASKWVKSREVYCDASRVGLISITRFPADIPRGLCNTKIIMRSEGAESISIKHLPYDEVKRQINGLYNV